MKSIAFYDTLNLDLSLMYAFENIDSKRKNNKFWIFIYWCCDRLFANDCIGIMPKSFVAVALSPSPVKRNRFIFLSILPIILGFVPLVTFCLGSNDAKELNGVMFGMAVMGMVSVYPDIYNIFNFLRVVPRNATIQNNKNETYYFE